MKRITLLINCNDRKGIIASITSYIQQQNGNIVYIDQHVDREEELFFMRLECEFSKEIFTIEDFRKDFVKEHLNILSLDDRLEGLSPDDRLRGLAPDEVFKRYTIEDRLKGLSPEEVKAYLKLGDF